MKSAGSRMRLLAVLALLLALTGSLVALRRGASGSGASTEVATASSALARPDAIACRDTPVAADQASHAQDPEHAQHHPPASATASLNHAGHDEPAAGPAHSAHPDPPAHPGHPSAAPASVDAPHLHDAAGACNPTPEQVAAANKLVEDTRNAIAKFGRERDAVLSGYDPDTNDSSMKTRIWHHTNERNVGDHQTLDPEHPEGLLYARTDNHGLVLVGAFYFAPAGVPAPDPGGCLTDWHSHVEGSWQMLHVWTVDMPGGPFTHESNPEYIRNL